MIPRFLVPFGSKPPASDTPSTRRRPSTMDERTLVPSTLPIIQLDGRSNIPTNLPLDSIAERVVVPRDVKRENFAPEEKSHLPLQPTEMDERVTVPQGAAPPEIIAPSENLLPAEIVDPDIFMTGEVNLLATPRDDAKSKEDLVTRISSVVFHILVIAFFIFQPKLFPPHAPTQSELDLARRQITVLLPPGAFDAPKTAPRPKQPAVRVDPRIIRKVAPTPEPVPTPPPKEPERVVKELPSAPVPKPNVTPPPPSETVAKVDAPKPPLKLETPEEQPTPHGLLLPKNSASRSIQDSLRDAAKMNAPSAIGGGGRIPNTSGIPGGGGQGAAYGAMELLTPTEGVNFDDYLRRVYITVKQNWFAVMPESVQLGEKGVVSLQFRIMRNGVVPTGEPVRVFGSGKEPLDRAAISSIRASTPFEPLPTPFKGEFIELRFTYYYNLQPQQAP
jgi:hypothetical protein